MLCKLFPVSSPSPTPALLPKAITGCLQKGAVNIINHCKWGVTPVCFLAVRLALNCFSSFGSSYPSVVVNLLSLLISKCFSHSHFLLFSCLGNIWVSEDTHSIRPFLIVVTSSMSTYRLVIAHFPKVHSTDVLSQVSTVHYK